MKRSSVLATLGAVALARPRATGAQSSAVRIGSAPIEEEALAYYAIEQGFFKRAGIDVELNVSSNGGGAMSAAIMGGSLDIGLTNTGSIASAHIHGLPFYLLACGSLYTPAAPISHVVVGKTLGIKNAKDLSGKTLAVSTVHDMLQAVTMAWIDQNGGDASTVRFVELSASAIDAAIQAGRIDGGLLNEPYYARAKNDVQLLGLPYAAMDHSKPFQTIGMAANADWVSRNPALAKRVAAVLHQAAHWANTNHAEASTLLARYTGIEPGMVVNFPRITWAETNDAAFVQPVIDLMAHYAILPKTFPARELFVPRIS
jgi:NitT/TauT family transport system substrate-binding protein